MSAPRFGVAKPGLTYLDRPAAFGVLERGGRIAAASVNKPGHASWCDLPGGAVDPGEDDAAALVREFGEETGLRVRPGVLLGRADQFFISTTGEPFNNRAALFVAELAGESPELKIEADHELVWLTPLEAVSGLRHDAHAWAVTAWLRRG